jgi:hypothetical protein
MKVINAYCGNLGGLLFLPFTCFFNELCCIEKVEIVSKQVVLFGTKTAQRCIYVAQASAICLPVSTSGFLSLAFGAPEFLVIYLGPSQIANPLWQKNTSHQRRDRKPRGLYPTNYSKD